MVGAVAMVTGCLTNHRDTLQTQTRNDFNDQGDEIHTDYYEMMKIVRDAGYTGYVGIEYEGSQLTEEEGILKTKALLEKVGSRLI